MEESWLLYGAAAGVLILAILSLALVIRTKRQISAQKRIIGALEEKGYVIEEKSAKSRFGEKRLIDELLFFIGVIGFVYGFLKNKFILIIVGLSIMFLSLYILHFLLKHKPKAIRRERKPPIEEKEEEVEEKPNIIVEKEMDEDVKKVLRIVDDLLEKLPEEEIEKFSMSKDYELYKKVMKEIR